MNEKIEMVEICLSRKQWELVVETLGYYIEKAEELKEAITEGLAGKEKKA